MKKIKSYEVVLENCDSFEFDAKYVSAYIVQIGRSYFGHYALPTAEHAAIMIEKRAKSYNVWGDDWKKRIDRDITQLHINYEDGTHEEFHLNWDIETSDYVNSFEKDIDDGDRMVYIVSATKNSLADFS